MSTGTLASSPSLSGGSRLAACAAHASLAVGVPVIVPLIVWALNAEAPFVRKHAGQALRFQLGATIASVLLGVLAFATGLGQIVSASMALAAGGDPSSVTLPANWYVPYLALMAAMLVLAWASIVELVAAVQAMRGRPAKLPFTKG
jgi:uncharacterized Tic20 family protein